MTVLLRVGGGKLGNIEHLSQNSLTPSALSYESETGYFGVSFVLFTTLCKASETRYDCGHVGDLWENISKGNNSSEPKWHL